MLGGWGAFRSMSSVVGGCPEPGRGSLLKRTNIVVQDGGSDTDQCSVEI